MKTCSVIVTSYNGLEYSKLCYKHYKFNTFTDNIKLIWVDNASTDGTRDWLDTIDVDNVIKLDKNYGASYARNTAVKEAETDALCFIDNDIRVTLVGWINRLLRTLYNTDNCGSITPSCNLTLSPASIYSFTETVDPVWSREIEYTNMDNGTFGAHENVYPYINYYLSKVKWIPFEANTLLEGGGTTMDRETFLETDGFSDFMLTHDGVGLRIGLNKLALDSWIDPSVFVFHYGHATRNASNIENFYAKLKEDQERAEVWKKAAIK